MANCNLKPGKDCPPDFCDACAEIRQNESPSHLRRDLAKIAGPGVSAWSEDKISGFRAGFLASQLRIVGEPSGRQKVRILVAEDTRVERILITKILESEGYEVVIAENGQLALDRLVAGEEFDLLITDQQMPEMTGLMLLDAVRARWPGFPAIMMTADTSQTVSIEALRAGVTDFIPKPLNKEILLLRIHRILRGTEAERELGRAREVLATRERTLAALFENLPGMVYRCHRRDGLFQMEFASPGARDLTGYDPDELAAGDGEVRFEDLVCPEDSAEWHRIRAGASAEKPFTLMYRIEDRSGTERCVLEKGTVTEENHDGAILEGFVMDITEQKARETELAAAEVARQAAEATGQAQAEFLNAVGHELRTPLHHMRSYAEFLGEDLEGAQAEDLAMIVAAADRLTVLVNDLLDLSKLEAGKMPIQPDERDFRQVVDAVQSEASAHLQARRLHLTLRIETIDPTAFFDSARMVQVLVNLVSNAVKFSPEGEEIVITLRDGDLASGPALRVEVRDHGPGITPGKEQMIFDKFVQASESHADGGTGLGLAICTQIVEAHHGKISAATHPDGGAVFTVLVPREAAV